MSPELRLNQTLKAWILLSSFFHHMAGARSWMFGVRHGWRKTTEDAFGFGKVETGGANPLDYKMGLRKIEERHPLITLGVKNGLTLGEIQDWGEHQLREDKGFGEKAARRLGLEKTARAFERLGEIREHFTDALFKRFFAGLKAEAFVIEFIHELQKAQNRKLVDKTYNSGGVDAIAERVARLINADFGGLHLKRMGRNPTIQNAARLLLLAPDWTESNFRTVSGMIPGLNKFINAAMGDVPAPKGMETVYRNFWARVALRICVATVMAQIMLNGPDDSEEFWKEQALSDRRKKLRWTEVDITRIYDALGIETKGRKTFSIGGHFFDPLKLFDPFRLAKHKASPFMRIAESLGSGEDYAERPFTGVRELAATGRTIKKSPYEKKEEFAGRFPSTVAYLVTNMQPVQIGYMLRYLAGEEDGLSALMLSAGAAVHTAWPPRQTLPIIRSKNGEDPVYKVLKDLENSGALKMAPPAKRISIGGVPRQLTKDQYEEYLEKSSTLARRKLSRLIASPKWQRTPDESKADAIRKIIKSARAKVRGRIKRKMNLKNSTRTI